MAWLSLSALLLGSGYLSQIVAVRSGELSFISPFSYTGILVAVFYGYLIWDELPDVLTIAGIALIVGAGMYVLAVGTDQPPRSSMTFPGFMIPRGSSSDLTSCITRYLTGEESPNSDSRLSVPMPCSAENDPPTASRPS